MKIDSGSQNVSDSRKMVVHPESGRDFLPAVDSESRVIHALLTPAYQELRTWTVCSSEA